MQALQLRAVSGWRWVGSGWRLFRRQPFSFTALLFFYWLLLLSASAVIGWVAQVLGIALPFFPAGLIAAAGSLLVAVLTPALTVGFLQACRIADGGLSVHPMLLLAPLRAGRKTLGRLLVLGAAQMGALVLILLLTSGTAAFRAGPADRTSDATTPSRTPTTAGGVALPPTGGASSDKRPATAAGVPSDAEQEAIRREAVQRVLQGVAYLPVALLMWYAPLLVAWHGVPPGKALFFSIVAVWRNRAAFVVYGVAWLAIWLALSVVIGLVTSLLGIATFAAFIAAPLVMLLLTCMYCSVYPTYATVFVDPDRPASGPSQAA